MSDREKNITHARETLLYNQDSTWIKQTDPEGSVNVIKGAYDSINICDLIGFYILDSQGSKFPSVLFSFYRDDILVISSSANGHVLDKFRKDITHTLNSLKNHHRHKPHCAEFLECHT